MYFWGVKYKKKMTEYSPLFETKKDAFLWLRKHGVKLYEMFERDLVFCEK